MPIYEYQCECCNHCFEKIVFRYDDKEVVCPECCTNQVKKLVSSTSCIGSAESRGCSTSPSGGFG